MSKHLCRLRSVLLVMGILSLLPVASLAAPVVLFDQGHDQRFLIEQNGPLHLSSLAELFRSEGAQVAASSAKLTDAALAGVAALVISGPFGAFNAEEVESLIRFIEGGGRLAVMLHIGPPLREILARLGVDYSNSVIHEQENIIKDDALNFKVTHLEGHPLTEAVPSFCLYGGWALMNTGAGANIIAATGSKAWIDLDGNRKLTAADALQPFGVVVTGGLGKGRFVIYGDDAIFQNQHLDENNTRLGRNLAAWLIAQ